MRSTWLKALTLTLTLLAGAAVSAWAQTSLVSTGAVWRYLDNGTDQGTAWQASSFVDAGWTPGPAQLGYGDGDEVTTNSFGPDAANKYITTYYRHSFNVANPGTVGNLLLRVLRDDGAIVYLNGTEVFRSNMPTGIVNYLTLAPVAADAGDETTNFFATCVNPGLLVTGNNVLAVEVHQNTTNSSDLSFDAALIANFTPQAPNIGITSPTNGQTLATMSIPITVAASDVDGGVTKVEFYQATTKVGESLTAPYTFIYNGVTPGSYTLRAVVSDCSGLSSTSAPVAITVVQPPAALILLNADWRYLDNGIDQGTAWRGVGFNDSGWSNGVAELGYGDTDQATVLQFGPDSANKYPTYYFRKTFNVADPSVYGNLVYSAEYDDGAVVYLNGIEVARLNMPEGTIAFTTYAVVVGEDVVSIGSIDLTNLVAGMNTVAVEVHQGNAGSSDISFNFSLAGNTLPNVTITSPSQNQIFSGPLDITLTASASDNDGSVNLVEFFANGIRVGEDATSPYSVLWTNVSDNVYTITAVATDNNSAVATSAPITITVNDPNPPALASVLASTNQVFVTFTKRVAAPTATTPGNYTINNGAGVNTAAFSVSQSTIVLETTVLTRGVTYTLTVNNVQDAQGRPIASNSQLTFSVADFLPQDVGNPPTPGSSSPAGNGYAINGSGAIGGTIDSFFFTQRAQVGDFDLKVRLESLSLSDSWAEAGLMARESFATNSAFAAALATPASGISFFKSRASAGAAAVTTGAFPVNYPYTWLRLKRAGLVMTGYGSWDGENWSQLGSTTFPTLSATLYFGLAVASHTSGNATGQFRDLMTATGAVSNPRLSREALGPSNRRSPFSISEIMYNPRTVPGSPSNSSLEFVEIFNSQAWDENIGNYRLSGAIDFDFPPGTIIKSGGFLVVARQPAYLQSHYGIANVMGPWIGAATNGLPNDEGTVRFRGAADEVLLQVEYSHREPWPLAADGTGHSLVLARASYGESDTRAWDASDTIDGSPGRMDPVGPEPLRNIVINEYLAHTDNLLLDFVELYNHGNSVVNLSGALLMDAPDSTNRYRIADGTMLNARSAISFNETTLGFGLSSEGERIYLVNSNQTRVVDSLSFEGQANGISTGRYPDGSTAFYELSSLTPGMTNSAPLLRDIVINEIMYSPISGNDDDEFVELHNRGAAPVNVGKWRFTAGIDLTLPDTVMIPAGGYLVIARNATNLIARYSPLLTAANTIGNYSGALGNAGERLALSMPDRVASTNGIGQLVTNTIYIVIDEVTYGDGGRWGFWADGGGSSLELKDPRSDNRQPANWADSDESNKSTWGTIQRTAPMGEIVSGGSSGTVNDRLQIFLLGIGECLLDDVVVQVNGGPNAIPTNPGFESGSTGWDLMGSHDMSSAENVGFSGSGSLHIRAASRGDNGANLVRSSLFNPPASGTLNVSCKARWLRGSHELLLRVRGGGFEVGGALPLPINLGSPGAVNSKAVGNAGPAIWDLNHSPVLPAAGEPVVVAARAHDPNGINTLRLRYRIGTGAGQNIVMLDTGAFGDAVAGDGIYSATLPQQSGGVLSFYVEAVDTANATNTFPQNLFPVAPLPRVFPTDAASREIAIRWGESMQSSRFGTYRVWLTPENTTRWNVRRPVLNNAVMDGTFVYNNSRVIYNMAPQYAGSPWHRGQMTSGPDGGQRCDYDIEYYSDDKFLGATDAVWNNPGNPEGGNTTDTSGQSEQTTYLLFKGLNIHYNYRRYINIFVNGVQRNTAGNVPGGQFIMEDSQQPNSDTIDEWFNDDTEGDLYKIEDWFEFNTAVDNFDINDADLTRRELANGELHMAAYRFMWRKRAVSADQLANDYSSLVELINIVSPDSSPNSTVIDNLSGFTAVANWEQWMRIFAVQHAVGNWDGYSYRRGKNAYMYQPTGGQFDQWTWDIDFTMGVGGDNPPVINATDASDPRILSMLRTPPVGRAYYRALQDLLDGPFSNSYMDPILDAKAAAFRANNVNFVPGTLQTIKNYITTVRGTITTALAANGGTAPFSLNGSASITTSNNLIIVSGTAPVRVKDVYINSIKQPVVWTSATAWTVRLTAQSGTNIFRIVGYNSQDLSVTPTNVLTVNYTGPSASPEGTIVLNEIMYNPTTTNASFVEIHNRSSSFAFDISGWRVNGLDFTFVPGTIITNGEYLVLAKNPAAFASAYGGSIQVAGQFDGNLDLDGETISLIKPGATPAQDVIVDRVRYEPNQPWPVAANGSGPSLQVVDNSQDNSRPSNWSDGLGWRFFSFTGVIGGNRLLFFLNGAGTIHIDNITVVTGAVAGAGVNLAVNGDFEGGMTGWASSGVHTNSFADSSVKFAGNSSLALVSVGVGGASASVNRMFTGIVNAGTYTMSFWFLPATNNLVLTARFGSFFRPDVDVSPIFSTPGALNSAASFLPPYPALWLNELQPNNTTGILDNNSEREPWIELYNAGPTNFPLNGLFLANNYSNLTQWAFPMGSSINPGEYKVIWADGESGETAGAQLHTNFRLNTGTGTVALARMVAGQPQVMDYLNYPVVGAGLTYGDFPDGQPFSRIVMFKATPGTTNESRDVDIFINEFMASNTNFVTDPADDDFDDWFELYNAGTNEVNLAGYYLSDDPLDRTKFIIPSGYIIPAGGFLLVWADEELSQNNTNNTDLHADFKLSATLESINLYTPEQTLVDSLSYSNQVADISEGRFPDGSANRQSMPTPTPRGPNNGGGGNTPPVIDPIAPRTATAGQTVSFTVTGSDVDNPPQTLTYSLDAGAPPFATLSGSGLFNWPIPGNQAPNTYNLTARLTDNGAPPRSGTRSFQITVLAPPQVAVSRSGNQISMTFATIPGKTYRVQYKANLNDLLAPWSQLGPDRLAAGISLTVQDDFTLNPTRFYRIVQVD